MTVSLPNTSIALNVHKPKKDAVSAIGAPTVNADDVAIWAGANINPGLVQSIIGGFDKLVRYTLNQMSGQTIATVHMPLGGGDNDIVVGGLPTADDLVVEFGQNLTANGTQRSHYIDRTWKRLREAWLEGVQGVAPIGGPTLNAVAPNVYTANGMWPGGTVITFQLVITDPNGQIDNHTVVVTLPPGLHNGPTVAGVCAATLDPFPHIDAIAVGNVLTLEATDPNYSLSSSVSV